MNYSRLFSGPIPHYMEEWTEKKEIEMKNNDHLQKCFLACLSMRTDIGNYLVLKSEWSKLRLRDLELKI